MKGQFRSDVSIIPVKIAREELVGPHCVSPLTAVPAVQPDALPHRINESAHGSLVCVVVVRRAGALLLRVEARSICNTHNLNPGCRPCCSDRSTIATQRCILNSQAPYTRCQRQLGA